MTILRTAALIIAFTASTYAWQAAPCTGLPPGKHSLLERMTAQFGLSCEQQLRIEPLLHDEESVTKPLLKFSSLSREDQQSIMLTVKLAARRQIRNLLTAHQQKGMDAEVDNVLNAKGGGGKKKAAQSIEAVPGLDAEEALSKAIVAYAALNASERKAMLLKVKQAVRSDAALQLTPEQQTKLDTEIKELSR